MSQSVESSQEIIPVAVPPLAVNQDLEVTSQISSTSDILIQPNITTTEAASNVSSSSNSIVVDLPSSQRLEEIVQQYIEIETTEPEIRPPIDSEPEIQPAPLSDEQIEPEFEFQIPDDLVIDDSELPESEPEPEIEQHPMVDHDIIVAPNDTSTDRRVPIVPTFKKRIRPDAKSLLKFYNFF